jgi:polysaccharide biosynthesis/export protein
MKMLINRYVQVLAVLLMVFCMAGAGAVRAEYLIGADDVLQIKVYGYDDLATIARVSENGRIIFPLVGEVEVTGQTEFQVAHKIAQLLAQSHFIQNANVSASIFEYKSQQVSVLGYIRAPGIYTLKTKTTLVDMIAMAGGIADLGDNRVIITRNVGGKLVKQEIDLRTTLEPSERNTSPPVFVGKGDTIYVPKTPVFYIYGEVQHSGSFRLEPDLTVAQAVSLGGGLTPRGTLRGLVIKRRDANGIEQEIDVELSDKVLKDDVIVVDERLF